MSWRPTLNVCRCLEPHRSVQTHGERSAVWRAAGWVAIWIQTYSCRARSASGLRLRNVWARRAMGHRSVAPTNGCHRVSRGRGAEGSAEADAGPSACRCRASEGRCGGGEGCRSPIRGLGRDPRPARSGAPGSGKGAPQRGTAAAAIAPRQCGLKEPSGAKVHLQLHRARKHRATERAGRHEARTECPAEKPGCISQGMPSASARSSAGKQLDICKYCQRGYRGKVIPFHLCWFCGASPAWHHGRCCRLAPLGPSHREHVMQAVIRCEGLSDTTDSCANHGKAL